MPVTRRDFLAAGAAMAAAAATGTARAQGGSAPKARPVLVGMTDWNLGERGVVEKVTLAREIGLDGIQVSVMYPEDGSPHLRGEKLQAEYRQAALAEGVQICSLAIGNLGPGEPFKSEPMGVMRVKDAITVARNIGADDILLPMFRTNTPQDDAEYARMINGLKEMAPLAEKMGVTISLESSMSAAQHLRIIDGVGSPNIGVYMDPWNCAYYGHDPYADIPALKDHIHQVHVKNGKFLMSEPCEHKFTWPEMAELLYKVGYKGWFVLETGAPSGDLTADTRKNIEYVLKTFKV